MSDKNKVTTQKNRGGFHLSPQGFTECMQFAEMAAQSDMVPKDFKGNTGNCLIAMQMGAELGIPPLQALQNIAVVNGRPAVWGDLLPALAHGHPHFEYMNETFDESTMTATCKIKRRNQPEQVRTFSKQDAELAGIWGRNTWKQYPKRMLQMRSRGFAVRDVFPDALKGVAVAEDIIDITPKDYSVINEVEASKNNEFISADQSLQIHAFIANYGLEEDKFLTYLSEKFGANDVEQIKVCDFDKVLSILKAKIAKGGGNNAST